jgi:hypothetical protein
MSVNDQVVDDSSARSRKTLAITATLTGTAIAVVMAALSDGFYQDDDITHFLWAVAGWDDPELLFNWWSRPGYSVPAALPAHFFGLMGCRLFSVLQTALVAYLAYKIAVKYLGPSRYAFLAPIFVWLQPLCFQLSLTTLTETPAALYVTLAAACYVYERRVWACVAMSLACVTRYELVSAGLVLSIFVFIDALRQSQWKVGGALRIKWLWGAAVAMLWAPLLYLGAGVLINLPYDSSPLSLFNRTYTTEYGSGPVLHMFARWPEAVGLGCMVLAFSGMAALRRKGAFLTVLVLVVLGVHSWLFWSGGVASGGYPRFMVPLAGVVAVLVVAGLRSVWVEPDSRAGAVLLSTLVIWILAVWSGFPFAFSTPAVKVVAICGLVAITGWATLIAFTKKPVVRRRASQVAASVAVLLCLVQLAVQVRPLLVERSPMNKLIREQVEALRDMNLGERPMISQHVFVSYFRSNTRLAAGTEDAIKRWNNAKRGTLYLWENKYSHKPHSEADLEASKRLLSTLQRVGRLVDARARAKTPLSFGFFYPEVRVEVYERLSVKVDKKR